CFQLHAVDFCLLLVMVCCVFFFFQAEDGIRDRNVTGVQTCALPIWFIFITKPGAARKYLSCSNALSGSRYVTRICWNFYTFVFRSAFAGATRLPFSNRMNLSGSTSACTM